jgi:LysR family transcriptional regulator, nod-box dependent transcriptional activator
LHLDRFDLNLLVALDALLTEKHVSRAAEKLYVSQPAMSAALARLREYFNDQLLERVGSSLELTPRAAELVGEVRELLLKIRATLRSAPTFDPARDARDFRLVFSDYVASIFMPIVTRRLLVEAPHVRCQGEHMNRMGLTDVSQGIADFSIQVPDHEQFDDGGRSSGLTSEALFSDEFVLIMDENIPEARNPLHIADFLRLPYIEVRFARTVLSVVEAEIRRQKLPLTVAAMTPSFTAAACMIPRTPMTAIIPRRLAEMLAPTLGLALRTPPIKLPLLRETLVWHNRNDADPAHLWFRNFLHSAAADFHRPLPSPKPHVGANRPPQSNGSRLRPKHNRSAVHPAR